MTKKWITIVDLSKRDFVALCIIAGTWFAGSVQAQSTSTWQGTGADGNWTTAGNWVGDIIPGATSGTTNTDIALFNSNPAQFIVNVDAGRNIGGITFDTTSVGALKIGATANAGNALLLTDGGIIQMTSAVTQVVAETINAPLVLEGSYTFSSSATAASSSAGLRFAGDITGPSTAGTLTLAGTSSNSQVNTISGTIMEGAGSLSILKSGSGKWSLAATTLTGGLTVSGGTLILKASNALSGGVTIGAGAVLVENDNALGGAGNLVTVTSSGASLSNQTGSANQTLANAISLNSGAKLTVNNSQSKTLTLTGLISGQGAMANTGAPALILMHANTYSGGTSIADGPVAIGDDAALGTGTITFNPGAIAKRPAIQSVDATAHTIVNALAFSGTGMTYTFGATSGGTGDLHFSSTTNTVLATTGTFVVNNTTTFDMPFTGTNGFTKTGDGTMILAGASTYSGATAITVGTLVAQADKGLGNTSGVTVNGGTLDIRGSTAGTVTIGAAGNFLLSSGSINLQLGTAFDQLVSSGAGAFTITGGTFALNLGAGFSYGNTYQVLSGFGGSNSVSGLSFSGYDDTNYTAALGTDGLLSFTAIPEPSTVALAALGMALLLYRMRYRRRVASCA